MPDQVVQAPSIPRTTNGKVLEVPIKPILMGQPPAEVLSLDAMVNPESVSFFETFALATFAT